MRYEVILEKDYGEKQCTMSPGQRLGYHIEKMIDPILLGCF